MIVVIVTYNLRYFQIHHPKRRKVSKRTDCVFVIAGSGVLSEELKVKYTSSTRLDWIGKIKDEDMKIYYMLADIFAFPSITRNEAFGVVLLEAMFCRCAVVDYTIAGSGVNWVAKDGETCVECENRNIVQLAEAIDKLLTDSSLRQKMGDNAHKRVLENFTSERIVAYLKGLYKELIIGT